MANSKQDSEGQEKDNLISKIKATTGAWWKSKVVSEEPKVQEPPPDPEVRPEAPPGSEDRPAPSPEPRPKSRSGRRGRRSRKPSAAPPEKGSEAPVPSAPRQEAQDPISRSGSDTGDSSPDKQSPEEPVPQSTDSGQLEEKKPRRGRGRRGRKKGGKPQDKAAGAAEETGQNTAIEDEPAGEEPGRDNQPVVKLLINAEEPEECRLALLENGRLESIHVTTASRVQTRNNIYKARVVAVEPNLQAAFVDYGVVKNGFLAFSEIHPEYYKQKLPKDIKALVDSHQWKKLSISDVIEKGQELLVQVVKEEIGKKGANLTTYLSLPGRCVVLMPGSDSEGVSRKISGEERRNQLREIMNSLAIPEGIGWIVRTASSDITKTALSKDVRFLLNLWKEIKSKGQHMEGVGLLYQDHNCVMRFLRENFDPSIQEILVDDEATLEKVKNFTDMLPARQRKVKVKLYRGARPIFNQYSVEDQIESIYQSKVNLPSGGSIVIDPTEALVAIDVNSGSTGKGKNFEETIFQANMEAATELARQLRLRDLGGLIVVDFIDMRSSKNIREVEKQVKAAMKRDKAKADVSRISRFGLMQISRQKLGSPIESGNYQMCEHCKGRGTVRSVETLALFYLRRIQTGASRKPVVQVDCRFPLDVAQYLLNNKRHEILELEEKYTTRVVITADPALKPTEHEIQFRKDETPEPKKQA